MCQVYKCKVYDDSIGEIRTVLLNEHTMEYFLSKEGFYNKVISKEPVEVEKHEKQGSWCEGCIATKYGNLSCISLPVCYTIDSATEDFVWGIKDE